MFDLTHLKQHRGVGTVIHQSQMPSTSDIAKEALHRNSPVATPPVLVICDRQTAGRGQPGKSWQSDSKSLTFSWCIPASAVALENQPLLPLIAGNCVCEAIHSFGCSNAKLKWPNDVLIDRKKVAGILVEKTPSASAAWFVVGIGVNVNQTTTDFLKLPTQCSLTPPCSLFQALDRDIEIQSLLLSIVDRLAECMLDQSKFSTDIILPRLEYLNEEIEFQLPNGQLELGTYTGINRIGELEITAGAVTKSYSSGHLKPVNAN